MEQSLFRPGDCLLGGSLIMLPEAELDKHINEEMLGEDESDAFGEIVNIITGAYASSFEELYPQNLHLSKADLEVIAPGKVKMDSPSPFPEQMYYMSSFSMSVDGKQLGDIQILFPAKLLGFETAESEAAGPPEESPQPTVSAHQKEVAAKQQAATTGFTQAEGIPETADEQPGESSIAGINCG